MPRISDKDRVTYSEASRRRQVAIAEHRELQTARLRGDLLDREETIKEWAQAMSRLRDRLLGIPDRAAAQLAGRREAEVRQILKSEIEDALRSISG